MSTPSAEPLTISRAKSQCSPEMASRIVALLDLDLVDGRARTLPTRRCEHCGRPTRAPQRFCSQGCWELARAACP